MNTIGYQDIGSMDYLNSKPPSYPAISISIRSEADQVKSLRNPPNLPLTYTFGKIDNSNQKPFIVTGPSDDQKQLKYHDFSYYMMQNKSLDQIKSFIRLKSLEMDLDQKRVFKILEDKDDKQINEDDVFIGNNDPGSKFMQILLDKYYDINSQNLKNNTNKKKKSQNQQNNQQQPKLNFQSKEQIKIKIPPQFLKYQEPLQHENLAFMKIPLGLSSHISESHKIQRIKGVQINDNQLIMCNICCEEWFSSQFFRISKQCTHIFCITCAQSYIINKINASDVFCIKCPQDDCSVYFYDHEISIALNQNQYFVRKYMTIKKLKILNINPRNRWCINPKCNNYMKTEQDSALTLAYPQLAEVQQINFTQCNLCQTKFCQYCCYPAHTGFSCEQNYEIIYNQTKKKKKQMIIQEQRIQPCKDILSCFLRLIGYILLYAFYVLICIPLSLFYPFYMLTQMRKYKEINQNAILKVLFFLFLLILSVLVYPITLLMLLTIGLKIYFLPKARNLLDFNQNYNQSLPNINKYKV